MGSAGCARPLRESGAVSVDRDEAMCLLTRAVHLSKERATALGLEFVVRLLDMALLQVALDWEPDVDASLYDDEHNLVALLRLKLRLALAERGDGHLV